MGLYWRVLELGSERLFWSERHYLLEAGNLRIRVLRCIREAVWERYNSGASDREAQRVTRDLVSKRDI